ncbi:hypothetical protein [Megasphaera hutchinsoni]|nr:hypothetical protein [Megasphaera genomosp. type_2]
MGIDELLDTVGLKLRYRYAYLGEIFSGQRIVMILALKIWR